MLMLEHCGQVDLRTPTTPPPATAAGTPLVRPLAGGVAAGGGRSSCFGCTRLVWPRGGLNGGPAGGWPFEDWSWFVVNVCAPSLVTTSDADSLLDLLWPNPTSARFAIVLGHCRNYPRASWRDLHSINSGSVRRRKELSLF